MTKTASSLAILLMLGASSPATAAECLTQIDSITVQYDLPASEAFAGTQTGAQSKPPQVDSSAELAGLRHAPAGRPGAPTGAGGEVLRPAQALPTNAQLNAAQRKEVQGLLHEARSADALGNEIKCLEFLQKAQGVVGKRS